MPLSPPHSGASHPSAHLAPAAAPAHALAGAATPLDWRDALNPFEGASLRAIEARLAAMDEGRQALVNAQREARKALQRAAKALAAHDDLRRQEATRRYLIQNRATARLKLRAKESL